MLTTALMVGLCLEAGAAQAGVVLRQNVSPRSSERTDRQSALYVQDGMLRSESRDAQGRLTRLLIVRDEALYLVNVGEHSYVKMDKAAMEAINARIPAPMREVMAQLRAAKGSPAQEEEYHDTGRTDHAGGYACRIWEGGPEGFRQQLCVVPYSELPGGGELAVSMPHIAQTLRELLSGLLFGVAAPKDLEMFAKLNGVPVATHDAYADTTFGSLEQAPLPPATFEVPAGFTQTPFVPGTGPNRTP